MLDGKGVQLKGVRLTGVDCIINQNFNHPIVLRYLQITSLSQFVPKINLKMKQPHDEEEETGPSTESADQEERILARRLRIQKRIEEQKR